MREFILPPKGLLVVLIIIALIVGVQFGIVVSVQAWTKVAEGPCTFKLWSKSGLNVRLNLDCNGTKAWTENAEVILGYLAKPGPITCSLWASGKASCEVPK